MQAPTEHRYALKVEHRGKLYKFSDWRGPLSPELRKLANQFYAEHPEHTDTTKRAFLTHLMADEVEGFTRINPAVQLPIFEQNKHYKITLTIRDDLHTVYLSEFKYYADKNTIKILKRLSKDMNLNDLLFEIECEKHPTVRLSGFENLSKAKIKLLKDTDSILLYSYQ